MGTQNLPFLARYSGQTTGELLALEGQFRTDSLILAFEAALHQKFERSGAHSLSDEEKVLLAVEALEREVNNGGYHQFFLNTGCIFVPRIVADLERLGADKAARITCEAIALLNVEDGSEVDAYLRALDETEPERFSACDSAYQAEAGDLSALLMSFIRKTESRFNLTA
ncbi:hypothetical protein sos41_00750 [Alphaproteobacteria bacterium SO-S41]|nr:hypothetical protein sos41_00750 [Alphaproteobacteria bacterium SO-S41]